MDTHRLEVLKEQGLVLVVKVGQAGEGPDVVVPVKEEVPIHLLDKGGPGGGLGPPL